MSPTNLSVETLVILSTLVEGGQESHQPHRKTTLEMVTHS